MADLDQAIYHILLSGSVVQSASLSVSESDLSYHSPVISIFNRPPQILCGLGIVTESYDSFNLPCRDWVECEIKITPHKWRNRRFRKRASTLIELTETKVLAETNVFTEPNELTETIELTGNSFASLAKVGTWEDWVGNMDACLEDLHTVPRTTKRVRKFKAHSIVWLDPVIRSAYVRKRRCMVKMRAAKIMSKGRMVLIKSGAKFSRLGANYLSVRSNYSSLIQNRLASENRVQLYKISRTASSNPVRLFQSCREAGLLRSRPPFEGTGEALESGAGTFSGVAAMQVWMEYFSALANRTLPNLDCHLLDDPKRYLKGSLLATNSGNVCKPVSLAEVISS